MNPKCPKCGSELIEAKCENPETGETAELMACVRCSFRARPCEVYSRIVGYLRPVSSWNVGKKAEFEQRKTYDIKS